MSAGPASEIVEGLERWAHETAQKPPRGSRPLETAALDLEERLRAWPELGRLFVDLARADRRRSYLELQVENLRRLGWRLMRPLLALGLLAAPFFVVQRALDPALGFMAFLAGAAGLYVLLQAYLQLWIRKAERQIADCDRELSAGLSTLREGRDSA